MLRAILIASIFCFNIPVFAFAQSISLPGPSQILAITQPAPSIMLQGMSIDPKHPFRFDFILNKNGVPVSQKELKDVGMRQVKYFLAAMTFDHQALWVNLSPFEQNRVIHPGLAVTALGSDLLAEDFVLKQLASSLTHPDSSTGQLYWKKIYTKAAALGLKDQLPLNAINKVWIVPDKAEVYVRGNTILVNDMHLSVLVEEDYLALQKSGQSRPRQNAMSEAQTRITREVLVPVLEEEVNHGRHFQLLRQMVHAAILAEWYKRHWREAMLSKLYANQQKVPGINDVAPQAKEKIYQQYLTAYKRGVYNFIREDNSSMSEEAKIPRKFFSGGMKIDLAVISEAKEFDAARLGNDMYALNVALDPAQSVTRAPDDSSGSIALPLNPHNFISRMENPFLTNLKKRLAVHQQTYPDLIAHLLDQPKRITKGWEQLGENSMYHVRDNRTIGNNPGKGGIRWITAGDLLKDHHFREQMRQFNSLASKPTEDEMKDFIAAWIDQETQALALSMALKNSGVNLGLGGAKGGVFIGNMRLNSGQWEIVDWYNDKDGYIKDTYAIARLHARRLTEANAVGLDVDSPAPDMRTNPYILEVYNDEYIRVLVEQSVLNSDQIGKQYRPLIVQLNRILKSIQSNPSKFKQQDTPFLDAMVAFRNLQNANGEHLPLPWLGVFTGKRVEKGGASGREEATGRGVIEVAKTYFIKRGMKLEGKTVAVQAFGNVGRYAALHAAKQGALVKVISDEGIVLVAKDRWSLRSIAHLIRELRRTKDGKLKSIPEEVIRDIMNNTFFIDGVKSQSFKRYTDGDLDAGDLDAVVLGADVDIFIPAFKEAVVHDDNWTMIKAKYVIEAANAPITPSAKKKLEASGKIFIPDTLANAGGVTSSRMEMDQARGEYIDPSDVDKILQEAASQVYKTSQFSKVSMSSAFDRVALANLEKERLADQGMKADYGGIDLNISQLPINQKGQAAPQVPIGDWTKRNVAGFTPVFVSLKPIQLPFLMGISQ